MKLWQLPTLATVLTCLSTVAVASEVPPTPATTAYWARCAAMLGVSAAQIVRTRRFGETSAMTPVLTRLVMEGEKTITTTSPWLYAHTPALRPVVGGYSVVVDEKLAPRSVIQTTRSIELPYNEVTEEYSRHEGAAIRPIAAWRDTHWRFFTRELAPLGKTPTQDMTVTLEMFKVVCPPTVSE